MGLNCSRCGEPRDGAHKAYCKACFAEYSRDRRAANPEAQRAYQRSWQQQNQDKTRAYRRKFRLKSQYGLTVDEFQAMLASQDGACSICEVELVEEPGPTKLCIDHDHTTGKVRGLLCSNCNFAVGLLADDPDRALALVAYLRRNILRLVSEEDT